MEGLIREGIRDSSFPWYSEDFREICHINCLRNQVKGNMCVTVCLSGGGKDERVTGTHTERKQGDGVFK